MDEILVHISASATRENDELYRSLADAYFDFEPLSPAEDGGRGAVDGLGTPNGLDTGAINPAPLEQPSTCKLAITTSDESYGSFPSHISSERDIKGLNQSRTYSSFDSNEDPTQPESRLGQLEQLHAEWRRKRNPALCTFSTRPPRTSRIVVSSPCNSVKFIEDSWWAENAIESQLYDDGSTTSEATSEDEEESSLAAHTAGSALCLTPKRGPTPLVNSRSISKSPTVTRTPKVDSDIQPSPASFASTHPSQRQTPSITHDLRSEAQSPGEGLQFHLLSFEVFPPPPNISVESPASLPSQITKSLAAIKQQNPGRFKPSRTHRALETDERGYWLVECSNWPRKLQYDFWSSLCDYVRSGTLGWGVTLHRESPKVPTHSLGRVRLYCWGEVVEYMWLYLWLCSKGKVSGAGSKWLDAEDTVVIQMP
ncbi:hypothetical protein BCR34DRAFT_560267 [Clohesyomyces aquaticus]|uniref:Uncharacterized protein n=1 Tax=Clohesyomyces aquaticus TaxID=1231657 RepID=A0A1Y1ZXS8_9PLEO|nr:hypothetical protein BCR34DRAFT_560267 [Clohesyomyces aquaticus]